MELFEDDVWLQQASHDDKHFVKPISVEVLYQAFKSRLMAETTMERFPNLDCQGISGDIGKTDK